MTDTVSVRDTCGAAFLVETQLEVRQGMLGDAIDLFLELGYQIPGDNAERQSTPWEESQYLVGAVQKQGVSALRLVAPTRSSDPRLYPTSQLCFWVQSPMKHVRALKLWANERKIGMEFETSIEDRDAYVVYFPTMLAFTIEFREDPRYN